jgi:hypothetical protein
MKNAVACGLRSPQWGTSIHNRFVGALSTHAGAPAEIVNGKLVDTTHQVRLKSELPLHRLQAMRRKVGLKETIAEFAMLPKR